MKVRKITIRTLLVCALVALTWGGVSSKSRRQAGSKANFTITTTELGRDIKGYRGPVPVAVTFTGGKISAIKILPNGETPSYFRMVEQGGIIEKYIGLTPKQAAAKSVDGVTGATYSSRALISNIRLAAQEAQKR